MDPQITSIITTLSPGVKEAKATMGTVTTAAISVMGAVLLIGALAVLIHKKRKRKAAQDIQIRPSYGGYRGRSFKIRIHSVIA